MIIRTFRSFIHQSLQGEYQIIEAVDGKQGLQIAQEYMPDMIISDVMMPELDGIELCQTLKSDPKTSHIPLILLTAKTSEESELGGLDVGADDYIRKPFNLDILKVKFAISSSIAKSSKHDSVERCSWNPKKLR